MTPPPVLAFEVGADDGDRLDRVVARRFPTASRRRVMALFEAGAIRVDGRRAKKGERVRTGARVEVAAAPADAVALTVVGDPAAAAAVAWLASDDEIVAMGKPAGMASQPLAVGEVGTAANAVVARFPECAAVADDPRDGGLVHRLDAGTSGILLAARTRAAWQRLRAAFADGAVVKTYLALTEAPPVTRECDAPLAQRGARAVVDHTDGLPAHTAWEVIERLGPRALVRCTATTGRTHQVRVHLATCGAPIVGDVAYGGGPMAELATFFLHAESIAIAGRRFVAPLPDDRAAVLARLRDAG